ncbi:hypothetical protein AAG570_009340 [Ranatra chinensis]|uniref:NADPH:adrenodoxin oxidoreductase, mitochondrial n=1 Tax=Ranatra chinensis TaxID=642074 RepID=A0ABD0YQX0_9HEMI
MYEKLPVPFGLVRYGVAPDHPEVKNVINSFSKIAKQKNFRFVGNTSLGEDVTFRNLQNAYHAVVLAYGCSEDTILGIKGEDLKNVLSARKFVGWYNGLPSEKTFMPNLDCSTAIILGQGNVAVDVARILLSPIDELKKTDITSYALEALSSSKIKTVYLVGRRGPFHVAFTIKEFREMTKLRNVKTVLNSGQMQGLDQLLQGVPRQRKRLTELLIKVSQAEQVGDKEFVPLFLRKPTEIQGSTSIEGVKFVINKIDNNLEGKVSSTEDTDYIPCGIVLRSVGYRGTVPDKDIPFDSKKGRVLSNSGVYSSGWINTGPVGVILSTMNNAFHQAALLVEDMNSNKLDTLQSKPGFELISNILSQKGIQAVSFEGWEKMDKVEIERGKQLGKSREKIVDIREMLAIAGE